MARINIKTKLVNELGFTHQSTTKYYDAKRIRFSKLDEVPGLDLCVSQYKQGGANYWINHIPYDSKHKEISKTKGTNTQVFDQIRKYILSTQYLRKQKDSRLIRIF